MDFAVVILSLSSLPILAHNIYWTYREKEVDQYYGIVSGIYTFSTAIMVAFGFPGNMVMPVAFGIIGTGAFHAYLINKKKFTLVKGIIFIALSLLIYLSGVLL